MNPVTNSGKGTNSPSSGSPIIKLSDVTFRYSETAAPVLNGVSLEITRGSFTAILGHNGSGKSTLAKHMNAVLLPTSGTVLVNGMDTADENNLLAVRSTVGMVFQNPDNQIVASVVEDDVAFAPENLGLPPEEIRARVDSALKTVGMYEFRMHAPHLLSGGQKQRVAIAGVIAMEPSCIVLDEPTAMLDPAGRSEVLKTMELLCREKGITIVLITHHMEECINADRLVVMSGGSIIADGTPKQIFSDVVGMKAAGLSVPTTTELLYGLRCGGIAVPLNALSVSECAEAVANAVGTAKTPGKLYDSAETASEKTDTSPVIEITNLRHVYSAGTPFEKTALDGINLKIAPSSFVGILGHTGSGKSTLVQHLNGLLKPDMGTVKVCGTDIHSSKTATRDARRQVGLVFQYPEYQLFEETVFKDVAYGPKNMKLSEDEIRERVTEACGFVGVPDYLFEASPLELSGGQKRRVAIAGVMAMRPKVLVLDEPTAGLDPVGRESLLENLRYYRRTTGAAVILISHSMDDLARIAQRLVVLSAGRIVMDGTPQEVFSHAAELSELGLTVPQATQIAMALQSKGVSVPPSVYTVDYLRNALIETYASNAADNDAAFGAIESEEPGADTSKIGAPAADTYGANPPETEVLPQC